MDQLQGTVRNLENISRKLEKYSSDLRTKNRVSIIYDPEYLLWLMDTLKIEIDNGVNRINRVIEGKL